ncbi:hypothetical protein HUS91_33975, partial [Pseudomonas chlororaphis]|nr:hypothetical protein [Pseudomonas chlororaphis]
MFSRTQRSSAFLATSLSTLILSSLSLPTQAVEFNSSSASYSDRISALHQEVDLKFTVRRSGVTVDDLQKLQDGLKSSTAELEKLQDLVNSQARLIEELKRNTG